MAGRHTYRNNGKETCPEAGLPRASPYRWDTGPSLDEPDERGVTLQDTLCDERQDPVEATSRQLLLEKVGHVLKRLPEKEQAVVEGVYLNDVEQKHLAKSLDVSLPYVYRLQKRGIRRVRGMLSRFIHESRH